ncbi:MAG: hypothetical protein PSV13_06530 [Lacunisphaera sp.]|nr:hypothetical protein [Lacunisphaera sp.]
MTNIPENRLSPGSRRTAGWTCLSLLLAVAFLPAQAQFKRAELSREELVSIYNVPVDTQPSVKFVWPVVGEKYFRVVVEESPVAQTEWKVRESYPYKFAETTGTFIYTIESKTSRTAAGNAWVISIRIGGIGGKFRGWSGSRFILPMPDSEYQTESKTDDPDRILLIRSATKHYRLRMESSSTPFPS